MKKTIALCALALMTLGLSAAHADDSGAKLVRFDFDCDNMLGVDHVLDSATPTTGPVFNVDAVVFANVERNATPSLQSIMNSRDVNNFISIKKSGALVFADTAILYSNVRDVVITGSNGVSPALVVERPHHFGDDNMCYDSALQFNGHTVAEGQCCVHTSDHDHGRPNITTSELQ